MVFSTHEIRGALRKAVTPSAKEFLARAIGRKIHESERKIGILCKENGDLIKWLFVGNHDRQGGGFPFIADINKISPVGRLCRTKCERFEHSIDVSSGRKFNRPE